MGGSQSKTSQKSPNSAFTPKELYNLKQVYFYLCLHTTTLTSCPLDRNQFHSLFKNHRQYKSLWRTLFAAIDLSADNVIDFEEFLAFVTHLKRGDVEAKRALCFRLFDPDCDGRAEKADMRIIAECRSSSLRRPAWQLSQHMQVVSDASADAEDEFMQFFNACDEDADGVICYEDFEGYCLLHGETIVTQTLKLLEVMFDGVIEETGIYITATDVKNTKPHIDWQDHKIGMGSFFCCSSSPPVFTTPPVA